MVACGTALGVDQLVAALGAGTGAGLGATSSATQGANSTIGPDELEPVTRSAWQLGHRTSGAAYLQHLGQLQAFGRKLTRFFDHHDLLLTPVLAEPPAPLGRWAMHNPDFLDYRIGPQGLWRYSPFAPLANATGGASIALPAGWSSGGLPIGAMLTGPSGSDARLLQLAAELEGAGALC